MNFTEKDLVQWNLQEVGTSLLPIPGDPDATWTLDQLEAHWDALSKENLILEKKCTQVLYRKGMVAFFLHPLLKEIGLYKWCDAHNVAPTTFYDAMNFYKETQKFGGFNAVEGLPIQEAREKLHLPGGRPPKTKNPLPKKKVVSTKQNEPSESPITADAAPAEVIDPIEKLEQVVNALEYLVDDLCKQEITEDIRCLAMDGIDYLRRLVPPLRQSGGIKDPEDG